MKIAKKYILMIDVESTQSGLAFDFSMILFEKTSKQIVIQEGFVIRENCKERLFYNTESGFFGIKNLNIRTEKYRQLIRDGEYSLISTAALNEKLSAIAEHYGSANIEICAYNAVFDVTVCKKSGIILPDCKVICLMRVAIQHYIYSAPRCYGYMRFCLANGLFSAKNFISFSAQSIGNFVNNTPNATEPHIGLFDLLEYEYPIFCKIHKAKKGLKESNKIKWDSFITIQSAYNALHINN